MRKGSWEHARLKSSNVHSFALVNLQRRATVQRAGECEDNFARAALASFAPAKSETAAADPILRISARMHDAIHTHLTKFSML